jgi:TolC family type I secretion outer membrane protein
MAKVVHWTAALFASILLLTTHKAIAAPQDGRPLTLDECIEIALRNNPQVLNAERQLRISGTSVTRARAGVLPRLDLRLSGSRVNQGIVTQLRDTPVSFKVDTLFLPVVNLSETEVIGKAVSFRFGAPTRYEQREITQPGLSRNSYSAGLSFSQTLFDGGQSWNSIKQARAGYEASESNVSGTRQSVVATVMQWYFQVLKDQHLLEVFQEAVEYAEKQLERTQSMYELGSVAQIDVFQARVSLGDSRNNLINQRMALENSKANLNLAMGRDPLEPLEIISTDPDIEPLTLTMEEAVARAVENNPTVRARKLNVRAAQYGLKVAKGAHLPTIALTGNYSRFNTQLDRVYGGFDKNYSVNFGVSMSLNIFNGFATQASIEDQSQRYLIAQEEYEQEVRLLKQRVQQAFLNLRRYEQVMQINEDNVKAAQEGLRLAEERYRVGAGTLLDIINARVSLTRARATLVQAKYDAMIARAQLEQAMGTLEPGR